MKEVHIYKENTRKRYVQERIFDTVAGLKSSATVLLGPSCNEYVEKLIKNIASNREAKIYSYEINWDAYKLQRKCLDLLSNKYKNKIYANFANILDAEINRFLDIDLMCTIKTGSIILDKLFKLQQEKYKDSDKRKVFTFTVCSRASHPRETISFVEQLLKLKFDKINISTNSKCQEYTFFHNSNQYVVKAFAYRDGMPMLTFLIQY